MTDQQAAHAFRCSSLLFDFTTQALHDSQVKIMIIFLALGLCIRPLSETSCFNSSAFYTNSLLSLKSSRDVWLLSHKKLRLKQDLVALMLQRCPYNQQVFKLSHSDICTLIKTAQFLGKSS